MIFSDGDSRLLNRTEWSSSPSLILIESHPVLDVKRAGGLDGEDWR